MPHFIQQSSLEEVKNSFNFTDISKLPSELFNPFRLLILNSLYRMDFLSFSQLKSTIKNISDGNLSSHLKYLEKDGYISVQKRKAGRYSKQFFQLTADGKKTFEAVIEGLDVYLSTLNR